jgi:AcrR family transcriptional regulator
MLTKKLDTANITIIMENIKMDTHPTKEKLLYHAREEFYEKGYQGASLRRICSAAGVTTGAFYFFFSSKEEIYLQIIDPVISESRRLVETLYQRERENVESGVDNDVELMEFEYRYKKEFMILLKKSAGSSRENYMEQIYQMMERYYSDFFAMYVGREPRREIIRMLVQIRIQSNMMILEEGYTMEQTLNMAKIIGCYAEGGFQKLIADMKDVL